MGDEEHLAPYREAVKRFGPSFEATLWHSPKSQRLRFDVLIEMAELSGAVVIDAGCGQGDFAAHLLERGIAFQRYVGIDAMSAMIDAARERNLERCEFVSGNLVDDRALLARFEPDWVCMSGTLNTMSMKTAQRLLRTSFDAARDGIVFNFLSDRHHPRWKSQNLGPARRFDTVKMLDWSLSQTTLVRFRQDYLQGHDATISLAHERPAGE